MLAAIRIYTYTRPVPRNAAKAERFDCLQERMMKKAILIMSALWLASTPAFAGTGNSVREPVSIAISTADLALNTPEGAAAFRNRTSRDIAAACSAGERLNTGLSPDWQCRRELARDALAKMAALGSDSRGKIAIR
jgi:UrcA family protein